MQIGKPTLVGDDVNGLETLMLRKSNVMHMVNDQIIIATIKVRLFYLCFLSFTADYCQRRAGTTNS